MGETMGWEGVQAMQSEFVIALVIAIPIILLPVALIWYLNAGGIYAIVKAAMKRRAAAKRRAAVERTVTTD